MNHEKLLNIPETVTETEIKKKKIKSTTITNEIKILSYYELIDKLRELISKNPEDDFMNDRRRETIERFEKRIQRILHTKSFKTKVVDFIKGIF